MSVSLWMLEFWKWLLAMTEVEERKCWTNQISTDTVAVVDTVLQRRDYTSDATDLLI